MGMAFQLCEREDHKIVEDLRGNQSHSNKTYYPKRYNTPYLYWCTVLFDKFSVTASKQLQKYCLKLLICVKPNTVHQEVMNAASER